MLFYDVANIMYFSVGVITALVFPGAGRAEGAAGGGGEICRPRCNFFRERL